MSKVQFNLLPDVKMEFVKAQRGRNLVVSIALLASAVVIGIFIIILFTVDVVQKKQLSDADKDVTKYTAQLKNKPNIEKILTVQNQLESLTNLHQSKHITSRIFTYLPQITPTNAHVGQISLDFAAGTMSLNGTADSQHTINVFIDTLKFTTYKVGDQGAATPAFTSVLESSFSINPNNVSYGITLQFDPKLFANNLLDSDGHQQTPVLTVPKLTTTRSVLNDPANILFNGQGAQ